MNGSRPAAGRILGLESISIGDGSSRISSSIFFLVCFIPVFGTVLFGAVDLMTWAAISLLWAAIVILWATEAWRARGLIFNPSSLQLPLLGILLIGLIQLLPLNPLPDTAGLTIDASRSISLDPYATRFFLVRLIVFIVYFAACLSFVNTVKRVKKTVIFIVIFGAVMAFVAMIMQLASPGAIYGMRVPFQANPFGPFINQHHFAAFMEMTSGVTLGLLLGSSTAREKKLLLAMALLLIIAPILLTGSRGGMLSILSTAGLAGALTYLYRRRAGARNAEDDEPNKLKQRVVFAAGVLTLVIVSLGLVLFLGGDQSLIRGVGLANPEDASSGRLHFWSVALQIFTANPILGAGLDAFGVAFTRYDTWNGIFRVEQAHNDYLQMLADAGVLGFACVIAFIFLLFKKSLGVIASAGEGFRRDAAIGALAGCFGMLIHSFFDFPLRTSSNAFFFLLIATIATVSVRKRTSEATVKHRKRRSTSRSH